MNWEQVLHSLDEKKDLSNEQLTWAMSQILEGIAENTQIKHFLSGLKAKGESASEVRTLVDQMYKYAAPINITERAVDIVGTGGDGECGDGGDHHRDGGAGPCGSRRVGEAYAS